ncbi:zinc finger c-x8-C-x5-C-x3-H type (and similar) domain-containing protein [Ditylenchus destructor]|uniref:Zinc finger c-x8-C-x5-C-x3-H type (And similar) domain-containing protein n=1 Tax=Ditylenchus destructor TaxID=166010 RepID=A0AAD4N032_9BILA|nr:zinc finger c-x8-C-x5-C-x3-H type (and similar) domain-containing protein [Ditylenchus destructor]
MFSESFSKCAKNHIDEGNPQFYGMENQNAATGTANRLYGSPRSWFSRSRPVPQFLDNNRIANPITIDANVRLVDGISEAEWHAMSDHRRQIYLQEKRKSQAFKTGMCKDLARTGLCAYGQSCRFAHSPSELRVRTIHPKFKTELCRNFALSGSCSYGSRCQFIHRSPSNDRQLHCSAPPAVSSRDVANTRFQQSCRTTKETFAESEYPHNSSLVDRIVENDTAVFLSDYMRSNDVRANEPISSGGPPQMSDDDFLASLLNSTFGDNGNPFCRSCFSTMPTDAKRKE